MIQFKTPWLTFLIIIILFIITQHFDMSRAGKLADLNIDGAIEVIEKGSFQRQAALMFLGVFSLISLILGNKRKLHPDKKIIFFLLGYISLIILSIYWSENRFLTFKRVIVFCFMAFGAFAMAKKLTLRQLAQLTFCYCWITLAVSIGTELYLNTLRVTDPTWRFSGVIHPVAQGWNCGLLIISSLYLSRPPGKINFWYFISVLSGLIFLILTKSRMPMLSALVGASLIFILTSRHSARIRMFIFSCFIVFFLGFTYLFALIFPSVQDEVSGSIAYMISYGRSQDDFLKTTSLSGRIPVWKVCFDYIAQKPLLGYGYNIYNDRNFMRKISDNAQWAATTTHSGYISTALGQGFIGLFFLIATLILFLKKGVSIANKDPYYAFAPAVLAWLIINITLETAVITDPIFPTFLVMIVFAKLSFREIT